MAEQHTRNARTPETSEYETLAAAEQPQSQPQTQQPAARPARRGKAGTGNGSAKRISARKRKTGEIDALASHDMNNGVNGANGTSNGANGAHDSANEANGPDGADSADNDAVPKKARTRKKPLDAAASPAVPATADEAAIPPRKRKPSQKSPSSRRRKTAQTVRQVEASPQESQESAAAEAATIAPDISIHTDAKTATPDGAPFASDLDPTPVKARETPPHSLADIEAELDALLSELTLEEPLSELEDTMARPALRVTPPAPTPAPMLTKAEAAPAPAEGIER